jgi:allantoinase
VTPAADAAAVGSAPAAGVSGRPVDLVIHAQRAIIEGQEQSASVLIRMGRIVGIEPYGASPPSKAEATLLPHEVLIPGLVDTHVHINEPGRTDVDRPGAGRQKGCGPRTMPGRRRILGWQRAHQP